MNCAADECGYDFEDLPFPRLFFDSQPLGVDDWYSSMLSRSSELSRTSDRDINGSLGCFRKRVALWSE